LNLISTVSTVDVEFIFLPTTTTTFLIAAASHTPRPLPSAEGCGPVRRTDRGGRYSRGGRCVTRRNTTFVVFRARFYYLLHTSTDRLQNPRFITIPTLTYPPPIVDRAHAPPRASRTRPMWDQRTCRKRATPNAASSKDSGQGGPNIGTSRQRKGKQAQRLRVRTADGDTSPIPTCRGSGRRDRLKADVSRQRRATQAQRHMSRQRRARDPQRRRVKTGRAIQTQRRRVKKAEGGVPNANVSSRPTLLASRVFVAGTPHFRSSETGSVCSPFLALPVAASNLSARTRAHAPCSQPFFFRSFNVMYVGRLQNNNNFSGITYVRLDRW
jgi:hypothetical protein